MFKALFCSSVLLLSSSFVPHLPGFSSVIAEAKSNPYVEVKHIPPLLGLDQGTWIQTSGLASGKMHFTALSSSTMHIHQEITLSKFGRAAIDQLMTLSGKKLSSRSNKVIFRFEVNQLANGDFEYILYDSGNNQMLISGPVKVLLGPNNAQHQEVEFKAELVKMTVFLNRGPSFKGKAAFALGVVPVPGSLNFIHWPS